MGELEKAATYFERSITHNPALPFVHTYLAATYAHLGREKEARKAYINYCNRLTWAPSLRILLYWYPFKDNEVAERLASGLLKSGIEGEPNGYYKIREENQLTGDEIRKLVFEKEFKTKCPWVDQVNVFRTKEGIVKQAEWGSGKSRIDGDMLCDRWESRFDGLEYCGSVFRNPEGSSDTEDEYLYVTDFQICELSPVKGSPSESYKISEENKFGVEDFRKLVFGRTVTGFIRGTRGEGQWWIEYSKDGKKVKLRTKSGWTDNGKGWFEGDVRCHQWEKYHGGNIIRFHIYRNPYGTPEKLNEYFIVVGDGIHPISIVE
jgi:hypothetical protein